MTTVFREPDHTYEDLVRLVTDDYADVEDLPALTAAVGGPGERLWLAEPHGRVYRVWRKGKAARWAMDEESALEAEKWIGERLAGTVLARLTEPGLASEYALDPTQAEADLAALEEFDRVWLSGRRPFADAVATDRVIRTRMARVKAELARLEALRARHLTDAYGGQEDAADRVATALGCDRTEAREVLAAGDRYRAWVRRGAADARATIPVHRPAGPTGLPDADAARLMTAACQGENVLPGHSYPRPLPPELAPWYAYIEDSGHCVAVAIDGVHTPDGDPWEYMIVAPVKLVLRSPWSVRDHVVVARIPYDERTGIDCDDSDWEL
jgi:hypothetical protein